MRKLIAAALAALFFLLPLSAGAQSSNQTVRYATMSSLISAGTFIYNNAACNYGSSNQIVSWPTATSCNIQKVSPTCGSGYAIPTYGQLLACLASYTTDGTYTGRGRTYTAAADGLGDGGTVCQSNGTVNTDFSRTTATPINSGSAVTLNITALTGTLSTVVLTAPGGGTAQSWSGPWTGAPVSFVYYASGATAGNYSWTLTVNGQNCVPTSCHAPPTNPSACDGFVSTANITGTATTFSFSLQFAS